MSTASKITFAIIGIIVLILIILGGWYLSSSGGMNFSSTATTTEATTTPIIINQSPDINSLTDSSDSSIDQDLSAIDAQLKNLGADSSTVEQSLKNQTEAPIQ